MKDITTVQIELGSVTCPVCNHIEWDVIYRCDLQYNGCLYDAGCQNCGYHMEVSNGADTIQEKYAKEIEKVKKIACSSCDSTDVTIQYRCELGDKKCLYLAVCNKCHTVTKVENI